MLGAPCVGLTRGAFGFVAVKLKDIQKGTPTAYREAIKLIREQIEFELETCEILFGTDPEKVLELLATESAWERDPNAPPSGSVTP
jgi:hypothetical protein